MDPPKLFDLKTPVLLGLKLVLHYFNKYTWDSGTFAKCMFLYEKDHWLLARYFICWWLVHQLWYIGPKLSINGFLPSTEPYWNWYKLMMCHYNLKTHNVAYCIFWCGTMNSFYNRLFIIVMCNEKQMN